MSSHDPQPRRATLGALRRLAPYLRPHRAAVLGSGACALGATLAGMTIPLVIGAIVDGPIARGELSALPWLALGVLGLGLLEAGLILTRRMLVAGPANRIEAAMRADLFAHLQRLPVSFHDRWPSGQLLSRATTDLTTVRWFVAFAGIFLVVNVATLVIGIGVLTWLSPPLGAVLAGIALPMMVATAALERRFAVFARRAQDQSGDLATTVEESALGIRVLRSLGRGRHLTARFLADARLLRGTELLKIRIIALLWLVLITLPELGIAGVVAVGAAGVAAGTMTLGTLIAAVTVLTYLIWPVASLGWLLAEAGNAAAATTRYWEVRDVPPAIVDPERPRALPTPVRGELELRGVRFGYPTADDLDRTGPGSTGPDTTRPDTTGPDTAGAGGTREVLRGVDLVVRPGETMALVGATGSGKTTLTALVGRLYDVTGGSVTVDGVDVRELRLAELRRTVATAFEDPVLLSASVRDNVVLGTPDTPDEQVWEALRVASADGFVAGLPHGLDTRIGEQGMSLSGGQRQRLALARAVVGRPQVLVLDDPLSALDVHTEAEVEAALRRVLGGVTALVVAHRPSTVRLADRVAVLADGRITAVGTHSELLATDPTYRSLLASPDDLSEVHP